MSDYRESQDMIARAELALRGGEIQEARGLFRAAAELQKRLVERLPPERVRTRSVFGLSAASLLFKADALDEAETLAYSLLADMPLEPRSREGLRDLLQRVWNEQQAREDGLVGLGEALSTTLHGGRIRYGVAPSDIVDTAYKTVASYIRRMGAWCNREPFARKPAPAVRDIGEAYQAFRSEPAPASYRIELYLTQVQPSLDLGGRYGRPATPAQIVGSCIEFARLVGNHDREAVGAFVPDERYRGTLLRLVRQLVPDGHDVAEVEIRRRAEPKEFAVRLRPLHREPVNSLVKALGARQVGEASEGPVTLTGVLRAVDLDAGELRVHGDDCKTDVEISDELHDIIGPMLNKRVTVRAFRRRRRKTLLAQDIDFAREHEPAAG